MNDRHTADTITDDALDQLYAPEPCDGRPCAGTGCSHEQAAAALTAHDEAAGLYTAPAPAATEATTGHVYLSTGCLHGDTVLPDGRTGHQYCQSHTGHSGEKQPAQCKFCAAPCTCGCHQPAHNAGPTVAECAEADRAYWTDKHAGEGQ
jgi:hypothetical protein